MAGNNSEDLPPIPNNAIRRLERALKREEKGAEAALLTEIYNYFEKPKAEDTCAHRQDDVEVERGALYVRRQSSVVEEIDGEMYALNYTRTYELDSDGEEVFSKYDQEVSFIKSDGESQTLLATLPNYMPKNEVEVGDEVEDGEEADYSSKHYVAELDEFLRRHVDERSVSE